MGQATVTQHGPQPMDIPFVPEDVLPGERLLHHIYKSTSIPRIAS